MSSFALSLIALTLITVMGVASIFPLSGMTGLFSFGQAAYMAIGAYVSGICAVQLELPLLVCVLAGLLASGLVALLVGIPTLKLRRDYFALMSLCLGIAITAILSQFSMVTGGAGGLVGIPKRVGTLAIVISAVVVVGIVACFKNSSFGRISLAIKTDELAASSFGIKVFSHKMKVYVFTSVISGFVGILYAFYMQYIDPTMFGWTTSCNWVLFMFFGGYNSLTGSVIAAIVLSVLPEAFRFATEISTVMYTVLILLVINFRPQGLMGEREISLKWIGKLYKGKIKLHGGDSNGTAKG
jgi:branched-chain amino acid transport system permease protein